MMEAGVVIAGGKPVFWHLPKGRTAGSLPDSRDLWDVLWENRATLDGFAHSHPGSGQPGPSHTDLTTFRAVERALGRRLKWWITSRTNMILLTWGGTKPDDLVYDTASLHGDEEPPWIWKLREHSYVPDPRLLDGVEEVDVDGMVDAKGVRFVGKARRQPDGTWRALADVGGALCLVECTVTAWPAQCKSSS